MRLAPTPPTHPTHPHNTNRHHQHQHATKPPSCLCRSTTPPSVTAWPSCWASANPMPRTWQPWSSLASSSWARRQPRRRRHGSKRGCKQASQDCTHSWVEEDSQGGGDVVLGMPLQPCTPSWVEEGRPLQYFLLLDEGRSQGGRGLGLGLGCIVCFDWTLARRQWSAGFEGALAAAAQGSVGALVE